MESELIENKDRLQDATVNLSFRCSERGADVKG